MQSIALFPGYHTKDLNLGSNGSAYNVLYSPSASNNVFGYAKELLKQTILKHEVIFRDQVHELHRLYRRQRELMEETRRREASKYYEESKKWESNLLFSDLDQKTDVSISRKTFNWIDLNEPIAMEEEDNPNPVTKSSSGFVLEEEILDNCIDGTGKTECNLVVSFEKKRRRKFIEIPIAVQALPCFNTSKSWSERKNNDVRKKLLDPFIHNSSIHDSITESRKEDNTIEEIGVQIKNSGLISMNKDEFLTEEVDDLEAPLSPQNKECSPPRGESEENQHEEELVRMAGEAIVLLSSTSEKLSNFWLDWFAEIAEGEWRSPLNCHAGAIVGGGIVGWGKKRKRQKREDNSLMSGSD